MCMSQQLLRHRSSKHYHLSGVNNSTTKGVNAHLTWCERQREEKEDNGGKEEAWRWGGGWRKYRYWEGDGVWIIGCFKLMAQECSNTHWSHLWLKTSVMIWSPFITENDFFLDEFSHILSRTYSCYQNSPGQHASLLEEVTIQSSNQLFIRDLVVWPLLA